MKRLFSGPKSPLLSPNLKSFWKDESDSVKSTNISDSGSSTNLETSSPSRIFSSPRMFTNDSTFTEGGLSLPSAQESLSPELVPIVTLLNAHTHRRYHEGVFLFLHDLKNNGSPGPRVWQEVYGVLIGTQLALWDAKDIAQDTTANLKEAASKPTYINFTDATIRPLTGADPVITESKQKLDNMLVVSTSLKNRYFLQFRDKESFSKWNAAVRLSLFECTSLQEAYTGAFLSSRGAKLGDIKVILADTKFDYEDWVSVRFDTGTSWKRCYAVVSQSTNKKKNSLGQINFYENSKKLKKAHSMATVTNANALYAVYPTSPLLIDTSTIIKLEGTVSFGKDKEEQEANIFIMPEKHHAVPGYDTIIRFLVPAMNAFKLYGRPKKLIASKNDQSSLLFALPTLPHVYYMNISDLLSLANSVTSLSWSDYEWRMQIKDLLQKKLNEGYTGCGSSTEMPNPLASPVLGSAELFESSATVPMASFLPKDSKRTISSKSVRLNTDSSSVSIDSLASKPSPSNHQVYQSEPADFISDSARNASSSSVKINAPEYYSAEEHPKSTTPPPINIDIANSSYDKLNESISNDSSHMVSRSTASDLYAIYQDYSVSPFGKSQNDDTEPQPQTLVVDREDNGGSAYQKYLGSSENKTFKVPRDSTSSMNDQDDVREEFHEISQKINEIGLGSTDVEDKQSSMSFGSSFTGNFNNGSDNDDNDDDVNIFDPEYLRSSHHLDKPSSHEVKEEGFQRAATPVQRGMNEHNNFTSNDYNRTGTRSNNNNSSSSVYPAENTQRQQYPQQATTGISRSNNIKNFGQMQQNPNVMHGQQPNMPNNGYQGGSGYPRKQVPNNRYMNQPQQYQEHGQHPYRPAPGQHSIPNPYQRVPGQQQPPQPMQQGYPQQYQQQQQRFRNVAALNTGPYNAQRAYPGPPRQGYPPYQNNRAPNGMNVANRQGMQANSNVRQQQQQQPKHVGVSRFMPPSTTTNPYAR